MGNFLNWLQKLNEMPVKNLGFIPDQAAFSPEAKRYGWDKRDAKLLSNPVGVEKFRRLWDNTSHDYNIYLVRTKNASKYREIGEVSTSWLETNMPEASHIKPDGDAITIIFTNNTGAEKTHFSAWTAAHRFGHSLTQSRSIHIWKQFTDDLLRQLQELLNHNYGVKSNLAYGNNTRSDFNILHKLATGIGTFRSARQNNLRNFYEFNYEILAQYLMSKNQIQFKTELPKMLATKFAWGKPQGPRLKTNDPVEMESDLSNLAEYCNYMIDIVLGQCINKIFVM